MTRNSFSKLALVLSLAGIPACATSDASLTDKEPEVDAPADGKLDGVSIADHGALQFVDTPESRFGNIVMEDSVQGELSRTQRVHAWEFMVEGGEADIRLSMDVPRSTSQELDTVMYLYRQTSSGSWGRYIRRNDDRSEAQGKPYLSAIDEGGLQEGIYRVVVKGYNSVQAGQFLLHARCEGNGCSSGPESSCFVGSDVSDVEDNPRYERSDTRPIRANTRVNMLLLAQVLTAVNNHERLLGDDADAQSIADVLVWVDRDSLVSWDVEDGETGRKFTAIEFSMGDTPVGSIYEMLGTDVVATINDGQILAEPNQDLCE